jgi:poly(A) polymerase
MSRLDSRILSQLQQTTAFFGEENQHAYLVGGSLRNILLGEPCVDWDIVVQGDAVTLARHLADRLGGFYAHLHEKANRVIVPAKDEGEEEVIFDIVSLKGVRLEDDLHSRDFTINAIATRLRDMVRYMELGGFGEHGNNAYRRGALLPFVDPCNGIADILARRIRAVDTEIFRHDPLRMLRAVRLRTRYRLTIDSLTEGLIIRDAPLLTSVAPERIHEELYAILTPEGAVEQLHFLDAHGLLTVLIPEFIPARGMPQPEPHYWDVLEHSIQTVGALERLAALLQDPPETVKQSEWERKGYLGKIQRLLQEAEAQGIFQRAILATPRAKLAALLHDIGKPPMYSVDENDLVHFYGHPQAGVPLAQQIMRRIKASTQDSRFVQQVTDNHMRPGQLAHVEKITPRAVRRYFVDLGREGIAVALLSLADHLATRGPQSLMDSWDRHLAAVCFLLDRYIRHRESILPPKIVSADELMHRFNLQPGPIIGRLLEAIAEAQAEGTIHSKADAFWLVEEKLLVWNQ